MIRNGSFNLPAVAGSNLVVMQSLDRGKISMFRVLEKKPDGNFRMIHREVMIKEGRFWKKIITPA